MGNPLEHHPLLRRADGLQQENDVLRRLLAEAQSKVFELSKRLRDVERQAAAPERVTGDPVLPRFSLSLRISALLGRLLARRMNVALLVRQGDARRDARDWAAAAEFYEKAATANPRNGEIWVQLGNMCKDAGWHERAGLAYEQAVRRMPRNSDIYLQTGHLRKLMGDYPGARQAYRAALLCDANNRHASGELRSLGVSDENL